MSNWEQSTWMITGTSSGFGLEIAKAVLAGGGKVVATARRPEVLAALVASAPDRVLALPLDVVNAAQITAAVEKAESHFGGIDVLVNNAGYGMNGTIEETAESAIRDLFEVNVFGLIAVTRAVLPGMRKRRHGFIVNISSGAGLSGHAGSSFYCASKHAVEGFTEALRGEASAVGVQAMAVEPGFFKTLFGDNVKAATSCMPEYESTAGMTIRYMAMMRGKEPGDPARAATAIISAMNQPQPPGQLVLGTDSFNGAVERMADRLAAIIKQRQLATTAEFTS